MTGERQSRAKARYRELIEAVPERFVAQPDDPFGLLTGADDIRRVESAAAARLIEHGQPAEWSEVGVVYEDPYLCVVRDAVTFPDGATGTYIRVFHRDLREAGAAILPVVNRRIALVRHFRHATRAWHYEIPRGFCDGATPATAARTELAEEIGATASRLIDLGALQTDSGLLGSATHLYLAEIDKLGEVQRAEGISEIRLLSPAELQGEIARGAISDSFTIAAFARALWRGLIVA